MIRVKFTHVVEDTADFPNDFRIQNGDGMVSIKNPATNEIVLQVPAATSFVFKAPDPQDPRQYPAEPPAPPSDVPESMKAEAGGESA